MSARSISRQDSVPHVPNCICLLFQVRQLSSFLEILHVFRELGYEVLVLDNKAVFHVPGWDMRVIARKV